MIDKKVSLLSFLKKNLVLILFISSLDLYALELGSERFQDFTTGAHDYGILVGMGHDPSISSNQFFTDQSFVSGIAAHPFPEGAGQKYYVSNMMNFQANYVMAAAKTEPRSPAFIMNSMDNLLTNPQAEIELSEGISASTLSVAQAGENAARYIVPEIITPEVGYYQTADNEQSFESAYENVLLGQAEEALFRGDESQAIEYFDGKLRDYRESSDKQAEAGGYQKDALMRSKRTAETFRDFFEMKAQISEQNLNLMPTRGSLLNNCQSNTPQGENQMAVYNSSMPRDEIEFYNFSPPSYSFNFCEQYVHNEESFLIRNLPVHGQLQNLVTDSTQMAEGLGEISDKLSDQSLSIEEIASTLANNEAWKKLSGRAKAYKECAKVDCLKPALKTFKSVVDYPGARKHHSPLRREVRGIIDGIIQSRSMPNNLSEKGSSSGLAKLLKEQEKELKKDSGESQKDSALTNGLISSSEMNRESQSRAPASSKGDNGVNYRGKRFPRGGGYFRGEDEVLRGPSGLPVQGYENSSNTDLFKIISRRYMIKFAN